MSMRDHIEALSNHICERMPPDLIAEAVYYGRIGLNEMSEEELREIARAWGFRQNAEETLELVLRTGMNDVPYREIRIPTTHVEFFEDRLECYNEVSEHFEVYINNGMFLAGHLPQCEGWADETAVFDFANVYAKKE